MATQHVTAADLVRRDRTASCCDCPKEADAAPGNQVWTIFNGRYYCPSCARREGISHDQ